MLRFSARILVNYELKQIFRSYKHNKYKNTAVRLIETLSAQPNPTFIHVSCKNSQKNRKIHTNPQLRARIFKDAENMYAYNILQSIPIRKPEDFMVKSPNKVISSLDDFNNLLDQNWRSKSVSEIVEGFKSALGYCKENNIAVSDERFDKLVDGLVDHVEDLTDSELSELLGCLTEYPLCDSYSAHNFHDIWSALDDICCWKMPSWSNETQFLFAEHWYHMNLAKLSDYMYNFIDRVEKRLKFMSKNEVVHVFFYLRIHKRHKVAFEYQHVFDKHIGDMSLEEIAVVAMAFLPSKTTIKLRSTVECIIKKLKQELPGANEFSVRKIVEILRYSSHVLLIDQLMDLLDQLVPEIDRLSNLCCIHIALLGTTLQFLHEKSLEKVSQKTLNHITNPNEVRLKDLERLLIALTMFDFNPKTNPDIFDTIYKELHTEERRKEIVKYRGCLQSALNCLSIRKIYSYEFMNEVLDMDRIFELHGKNPKTLPRDLVSLDFCIEIECPDYNGNRLDKTFRRRATKWTLEYTPTWDQHKKLTSADKFVLEVTDTVAKIVEGHRNLHADHVLPNFVKSDIIICQDKNGKFVQPSGFENCTLGDVMRPPNRDLRWFAVVPVSWNNAIRNTSQPLGLINMKCRQLKAIGYEPILVLWNEFLRVSEKERIDYILNKIR